MLLNSRPQCPRISGAVPVSSRLCHCPWNVLIFVWSKQPISHNVCASVPNHCVLKLCHYRESLVVQWLGLCIFTLGTLRFYKLCSMAKKKAQLLKKLYSLKFWTIVLEKTIFIFLESHWQWDWVFIHSLFLHYILGFWFY